MKHAALVVVAALATASAGGPVRAQSAESELRACVANSSGRMRIVPEGVACRTRETSRLLALAPGPSVCRVVARLTLEGVMGWGRGRTVRWSSTPTR